MTQAGLTRLRIYCICGQKMRVSATMLGRPGKCVACHQKIRIPRLDELPAGLTEIYLKDHPEFLRKRAPEAKSADDVSDTGEDQEVEPEAEATYAIEAVPLEPFEPLQTLTSLEQSIQRQLDALRRKEPISTVDKPTLLRYRALVRKARAELDEQLRLRLHEVTEQLNNNTEQIARATLAVRVGEMDYEAFLRLVVPLRHRRERLERRRQNLRGWLVVSDPYMAGGFVELRLDDVPCDNIEVTFPLETETSEAVIDLVVEDLRDAIRDREHAEHKLTEWKRMEREGALQGAALEECLADSEAVRQRSRAAVAFYRNRLDQVMLDCENDINAIKAHLDLARARFSKGRLEEAAYQKIELDLLRAQSDNTRVRDLARHALSANTSSDVPHLRGTFLHRMSVPGRVGGIGFDSWIAWAASTLLVLNILVPLSSAQAGGNMVVIRGMVIGLFVASVVLAMLASIPQRNIRGVLINAFWVLAILLGGYKIHELWYSLGAVGSALRVNPHWYLGPGIVLAAFTGTLIGVSAWMALLPTRRWYWIPPLASLVNAMALIMIFTNAGGLIVGRPYLDGPDILSVLSDSNTYDVTVTIGNQGWRKIWLGGRIEKVPTPVEFIVEEQIGSDSWKDAGTPLSMKRSRAQWWGTLRASETPAADIEPGDSVTLRYNLPPGKYRMQLTSPLARYKSVTKTFSLDPLEEEPAVKPQAALPSAETEKPAETGDLPPAPSAAPYVEIQLQGVMHAPDKKPSFQIELRLPNGQTERKRLSLGDIIHNDWRAIEYSPMKKTLTITNGDRLIILEPGQSYQVESAPRTSPAS